MHFEFETRVRLPLEETFRFFSEPANLARLQEGVSGFQLLEHAGSVEPGSVTWVRVTVLGLLPIKMSFEHGDYALNQHFREQLVRGPFARFEHLHEFIEEGETTLIRDTLEIELPWYFGGELAMALIARPNVRRLFRQRERNSLKLLKARS